MRRDYFICTFLLCICVSLFYVCFSPLYFVYGSIVPRDFGVFESICAWLYFLFVFAALPIYAAVFKKLWITAGLASYSFFCACLPAWILPGMEPTLAGADANIISVIWGFCLKSIYGMVEAPFAPISRAFGNKATESMPRKILPIVLIIYCAVQLYRFYRDAYIAEKLNPEDVIDITAQENSRKGPEGVRNSNIEPEILGTVISAPTKPAPTPDGAPKPAPAHTPPTPAPAKPKPAPAKPVSAPAKPVPAPAAAEPGSSEAPIPLGDKTKAPKPVPAPRAPEAPVPVKVIRSAPPKPAPTMIQAPVKKPPQNGQQIQQ